MSKTSTKLQSVVVGVVKETSQALGIIPILLMLVMGPSWNLYGLTCVGGLIADGLIIFNKKRAGAQDLIPEQSTPELIVGAVIIPFVWPVLAVALICHRISQQRKLLKKRARA